MFARRFIPVLIRLIPLVILLWAYPQSFSAASDSVYTANTNVRLVPQRDTVVPGEEFWFALHMEMDEHWHVYWENPGDSGIPPEIRWDLPEGWTEGQIQWPVPERIFLEPLMSYGYEGTVVFLHSVRVPEELMPGETFEIIGDVRFLACKIECVPGQAAFPLTLTVSPAGSPVSERFQQLSRQTLDNLPLTNDAWDFEAVAQDEFLLLQGQPVEPSQTDVKSVYFFPERNDLVDHAVRPSVRRVREGWRIEIPWSPIFSGSELSRIKGLLEIQTEDEGRRVYRVDLPVKETPELFTLGEVPGEAAGKFGLAVVFALIGGILLNLMPCVFPVLSLKVIGLVQQAHEDKRKAVSHSLIFMMGILTAFWVLVGILYALRAAGQQIGWGFQFQSSGFVLFMGMLLSLFGLNLLGLFEIGTGLTRLGGRMSSGQSVRGSFINGLLATVIATPCTAPFMGTALGYALSQPLVVSLVIFTCLGIGLALPYILLSVFPGLLRRLPKPGPWMEAFKMWMSLPLFLTVAWLGWVFYSQNGLTATYGFVMAVLVTVPAAFGLGRWNRLEKPSRTRAGGIVFSLLLLTAGFSGGSIVAERTAGDSGKVSARDGIAWIPFEEGTIQRYLRTDDVVFINFTAAWCITCQVNKRIALDNAKVIEAFRANEVKAIQADWTSYDPAVTEALKKYNKSSIPFYVVYGPDKRKDPVFLPEVLTPTIVTEALDRVLNGEGS